MPGKGHGSDPMARTGRAVARPVPVDTWREGRCRPSQQCWWEHREIGDDAPVEAVPTVLMLSAIRHEGAPKHQTGDMSQSKVDEVSIEIAASRQSVFDLVVDVTNMGRWSPETFKTAWIDPATGPKVGARFKGWNSVKVKGVPMRWTTTSIVRQLDPGRAFSFDTPFSGARWTFRFEETETGCRLTETREIIREPIAVKLLYLAIGGIRHQQLVRGIEVTLQKIKDAAEAEAPAAI